jgi:hypothetical protein
MLVHRGDRPSSSVSITALLHSAAPQSIGTILSDCDRALFALPSAWRPNSAPDHQRSSSRPRGSRSRRGVMGCHFGQGILGFLHTLCVPHSAAESPTVIDWTNRHAAFDETPGTRHCRPNGAGPRAMDDPSGIIQSVISYAWFSRVRSTRLRRRRSGAEGELVTRESRLQFRDIQDAVHCARCSTRGGW